MKKQISPDKAAEHLGVVDFVKINWETLLEKLNTIEVATHDDEAANFVAQSLPIMSGIVHVGSTFENYRDTLVRIKGTLGDNAFEGEDATLLTMLLLRYVVGKVRGKYIPDELIEIESMKDHEVKKGKSKSELKQDYTGKKETCERLAKKMKSAFDKDWYY